MSDPREIRALLFDLGGVLVELDWERMFRHWADHAGVDPAMLRARFTFDDSYRRHERGEIDAAAYYASLRDSLAIDVPHEVIDFGWKSIFAGEIEETVRMLRALHGRIPLYAFSNTNPSHFEAWHGRFSEALRPFDRIFTSCGIGARKPERVAFEHIAREVGVPLASILFFDDTQENVDGARAVGMPAVLVRSPADVRGAVAPWLPEGA